MGRKCWVILIAAIAITCSVARADAGLSYLGLCNPTWPCSKSLESFRHASVIRTGWLERSFGTECECADRVLRDKRRKVIRVHIANGPCLRNKRCGRQEIFYGYTVQSANRAIKRGNRRILGRFELVASRLAERLAKSRGALTCYVSPVLESDFDEQTRSILHSITASYLPGCALVDNPLRGQCIRGTICERHGPDPGLSRPCIADLDGSPVGQAETRVFLRQTRHCDMSFIWTPEMNCNSHLSQTFIDPQRRNCVHPEGYHKALAGWIK